MEADAETSDSIKGIVLQEAGHVVSPHAHIIKFASVAQYSSGNNFIPMDVPGAIRHAIRFQMPRRLSEATLSFMEQRPSVDEFYFLAGGEDDERIRKLELWYGRVADKLATTSLGLQRIHPPKGIWYGYRKADR
ncbi:hypothetical protein D3C84_959620 [compost metagenome]